jgi:DNA repair exonuclease SbcCD ATPase subunit
MKEIKTGIGLNSLGRIYHISDVHIRNFKRHEEYTRVFEKLYAYISSTFTEDSLIVLTGDIVHSKTDVTPELVNMVQTFLRRLCSIGPVLMIPGNHDANLNNSRRMDALTPIVNALNHKNLFYVIDTCYFTIAGKTFAHWSVFDRQESYKTAEEVPGNYKIAMFHGPVTGTQLRENSQLIDQNLTVLDFEGFDIALLGDIHTRQFLNAEQTIGYPGSLIQQNHGESIGKGIYVWDLKTKKAEYVEIENDTAFYTINVDSGIQDPLPTHLPNNLYLRVRHKNTSQSFIKDLVGQVKKSKSIVELTIQKVNDLYESESGERKFHSIDVRDVNYQNSVLAQFLNKSDVEDQSSIKRILEINNTLNQRLTKSEVQRNSIWLPKEFKFDNMFSYGEGNVVNFSVMEGTYGIFAQNASGKSTLLDSIAYCIFDKCSKTSKAAQVMNNQTSSFYCKLTFELHGSEYCIERTGSKQKYGNVKVDVDFYRLEGEEKVSLNGKDRNDTNANIRSLMGSYEDFVMTAMSVQNNNMGFVDMSQSDRKDLLSQFLDINVYEELYQLANSESRDVLAVLKQYQKEDYSGMIKRAQYDMETLSLSIEEKSELKRYCEKEIAERDRQILQKTKKIVSLSMAVHNIDKLRTDRDSTLSSLKKLEASAIETRKKYKDLESALESHRSALSKFNSGRIKARTGEWKNCLEELTKKNLELSRATTNLANSRKKTEKLLQLEYDKNCSYCMNNVFVKDAIETKNYIQKEEELVESLKEICSSLSLRAEEASKVQKESSDYEELLLEIKRIESEKSKLELEISKMSNRYKDGDIALKKIEASIEEYTNNQESIKENEKTNREIELLQKEKLNYESILSRVNRELTDCTIEYKLLEKSRDSHSASLERLKQLEKDFKDYQLYLTAVHRDGIPHSLITNIIPNLQDEINNFLSQIVDFSVVLQPNDKSINAYIAYSEDNFWPIELVSGMEKFVTNLAIRTSLISISSLPKPNFIAIDEGFGALDSNNIGSMAWLFDHLKTQFKFIVVISHIDSMRDIVDNHLEINKLNGRSRIEYL